jgi:ribonuclease D
MNPERTAYRFIADAAEAARAVEALPAEGVVSVDTETFWNPATSASRVSLVQIDAGRPEVLVFDALAVGFDALRPLLESPSVLMAAHNASFDQAMLRGEGLSPAAFVDTLSLSRAAFFLPSYSLAAVSEHLLGIPLDKTLRTSNWRRRPLTRGQIEYAAKDARVTLRVYEELRRRLEAEGRWEAAFNAALLRSAPDGAAKAKRRRKAAPVGPPLTPEEKRLVTLLKKWRLERAFAERRPAYMICPDRTLECLARDRPRTLEDLRSVYGLGDSKIERFGTDLLDALRDASGESAHADPKSKTDAPDPTPDAPEANTG